MRKTLNWYDVNYRYSVSNPTATDKAMDELVQAITMAGFWWIANLNEGGNVVTRYTNSVVLELKDDTPAEKIEEAKELTAKILKTMGATEEQIQDILTRNPKN